MYELRTRNKPMTAKIVTALQTEAARMRKRILDADCDSKGGAADLPPVSNNLIDTLFDAECGHRQEKRYPSAA